MQYVLTFAFMVLDFITGITMSVKNKNFNSSIMREGLFNKFGSICIVAVGVLIDVCQQYLDLGYTVPVASAFCVYIIIMEIGSIIENISKINKNLIPENIRKILEKAKTTIDN